MSTRSALNAVITALRNKEIGTRVTINALGVSPKAIREMQQRVPAACLNYSEGTASLHFQPQIIESTTSCRKAGCKRIGSGGGMGCVHGEQLDADTGVVTISYRPYPRISRIGPVPPKPHK